MTDEPSQSRGGSRGGCGDATPATRFQRREHLRLLETMAYAGWEIPPEVFKDVPTALRDIASSPEQSTRDRIRASEALAHLSQQMIDASLALDKLHRLDAGQATDRVELLESITDAQLAAVAASILPAPAPPPCPAPASPPPKPAKPQPKPRRRGRG
jgi:hypothetical protein